MKYKNPILRGMYPDPSVCRANDKYYLVCSTFQYFPAVPLFESDDMVNWHQIGHCITRESQLNLTGAGTGGGIYAPTIRYNNGRFYMVTTNVNEECNFYIYTDDIYGEWSEPIKVQQNGIDPSLFFENDKAYFISNGYDVKTSKDCIRICEINIETGEKLSETRPLWFGTGGRYLEAPHLYKFGDYYYILNAEGGTEYGHMVNYARSKSLDGDFEPFPQNPVLTNRNLGGYTLQGAGHGDIIEDKNGNWWFIHLGFRQIDCWLPFHHLGRETCLVPVTWKDGWFYMGNGTSQLEYNLSDRTFAPQQLSFKKTFENLYDSKEWTFIRNYIPQNYQFSKDSLSLIGTSDTLFVGDKPTFAGIRQSEFKMNIQVTVESDCQESGITIYMDEKHHYDIFLDNQKNITFRATIGFITKVMKTINIGNNIATLKIVSSEFGYNFIYVQDDKEFDLGFADSRYLSTEVACGFTGVMIGLYSIDNDNKLAKFTNFIAEHNE